MMEPFLRILSFWKVSLANGESNKLLISIKDEKIPL